MNIRNQYVYNKLEIGFIPDPDSNGNAMSMQQMLSELTEVTPSLFISSATAITENKLKQLGINLIVNATKGNCQKLHQFAHLHIAYCIFE